MIPRQLRLGVFSALVLVAACSEITVNPDSPASNGFVTPIPVTNLRGTVVDQLSGVLLSGAVVEAIGVSSVTGADGAYNLQNLQASAVQLTTVRAGYDTARTLLPLTGRDQVFVVRMRALPVGMSR